MCDSYKYSGLLIDCVLSKKFNFVKNSISVKFTVSIWKVSKYVSICSILR